MARDTEFYIMDKEIVKEKIYPDIISSDKFKESFENFIIRRKVMCGNGYNVNYHNIIKKVNSDINNILPSELFELIYWFSEIGYDYKEKGVELIYNVNGIAAYSFMFQFGNFIHFSELDETHESCHGHNIKTGDFVRFLDYMILLMGKIVMLKIDESGTELNDSEKEHISKVENIYKNESILLEIITSEFEYLKSKYYEHQKNNSEYSRDPVINTIFWASSFLQSCIEMKMKITEANSNLLIVDSI